MTINLDVVFSVYVHLDRPSFSSPDLPNDRNGERVTKRDAVRDPVEMSSFLVSQFVLA